MGFMNKISKMKSFFFDEVEEEDVKKSNTKTIVRERAVEEKKEKVVKTNEDLSKTQEVEELYFEDISDVVTPSPKEIKSRVVKNEPEFKFPQFSEEDFMVPKKRPEPIIPVKKEEPKPLLYQGSKRKEEQKKFKPSPMISPIYGLLDKEGHEVKTESKSKERKSVSKDDITFEEVRKKAYGNIDEEIENTLKRLSKKTIEEAEKEMEDEEKELSRTKNKEKERKEVLKKTIVVDHESEEDDDDMILPNINFREIDVDKERNRNKKVTEKNNKHSVEDDDDDDTKEQDLFNLIDTIYSGERKDN